MVYKRDEDRVELRGLMGHRLKVVDGTWLQKTLIGAPIGPEYPFEVGPEGPPWYLRPGLWIGTYLVLACFLLFVVLW